MIGEFQSALGLGKVAAQAGGKGGFLNEAGHLLGVQPVGADILALAGDAAEEGPLMILANLIQV